MSIIIKKGTFFYNQKKNIITSLNLLIESGSCTCIIGPSGCGKTTLLYLIANLLELKSGEILIDDLTNKEYRKLGNIGMAFQKNELMPWLTVFENIIIPLKIRNKKINEEYIDEILKITKVEDYMTLFPDQISGGMAQRVAIARALILNPKLILLDEPFSNLDDELKIELLFTIYNFQKKFKCTIVMITHNIEEAVIISNSILIFNSSHDIKKIDNIPIASLGTVGLESELFFDQIKKVRKGQRC